MIDHNAWLGRWPFRDLGERRSAGFLLETMDRLRIDQSWVSPLEGMFQAVPHHANAALFEATATTPDRLNPVPIIHPGLADTAGYLRALRAEHPDLNAIRLVPPVHGGQAAVNEEAMRAIAGCGLTVLLTFRIIDARARNAFLNLPDSSVEEMKWWIRKLAPARVIAVGCLIGEASQIHAEPGLLSGRCRFESSLFDGAFTLDEARELMGPERVVPGSNAPMNFQECMVAKWRMESPAPLNA